MMGWAQISMRYVPCVGIGMPRDVAHTLCDSTLLELSTVTVRLFRKYTEMKRYMPVKI